MDPEKQTSRYPALGFVASVVFAACMGWMLFTDVIQPSMQPALDYTATGSIR